MRSSSCTDNVTDRTWEHPGCGFACGFVSARYVRMRPPLFNGVFRWRHSERSHIEYIERIEKCWQWNAYSWKQHRNTVPIRTFWKSPQPHLKVNKHQIAGTRNPPIWQHPSSKTTSEMSLTSSSSACCRLLCFSMSEVICTTPVHVWTHAKNADENRKYADNAGKLLTHTGIMLSKQETIMLETGKMLTERSVRNASDTHTQQTKTTVPSCIRDWRHCARHNDSLYGTGKNTCLMVASLSSNSLCNSDVVLSNSSMLSCLRFASFCACDNGTNRDVNSSASACCQDNCQYNHGRWKTVERRTQQW